MAVGEHVADTVLVTGAAGFIGSHLCERLARSDRTVIGFDNFDPFYPRSDKQKNVDAIAAAGADFREADIRDFDELASLIDVTCPDVIVHLAAKAGVRDSVRFPRQYFETNLLGTQNLLDASRATGVRRLVLGSTSSVYGATETVPFVESDPCTTPLHPYAASKRSAELLCSMYSSLYGLQATILRLFTVYGERGRPDMMPRLLLDSLTSGREIELFEGPLARDWTYVSDVVDAFEAAVDTPLGFRILNVGRGQPVLLADFIAHLERLSGRSANLVSAPRPESEVVSTFACVDELEDALGIRPQISVDEGVERLWSWWTGPSASSSVR